jgi:hypothetical protein
MHMTYCIPENDTRILIIGIKPRSGQFGGLKIGWFKRLDSIVS